MLKHLFLLLPLLLVAKEFDIRNHAIINPTAYISSQCYTKTVDEKQKKHNPCFTCHRKALVPNFTYDYRFQEIYDFPERARINPFTNLFKDRTSAVNAQSDEAILAYVREDNYFDKEGIRLAKKLKKLPKNWDYDGNGKWDGYVPDCYFNFDKEGFDKSTKGEYTGWRAFAYYPFLGTFWPANGSSDDVMIRLDKAFRQNSKGVFDKEVYRINLAIVEALIKRKNIKISPTKESLFGVDLNKNGVLDEANEVVFRWAPLRGIHMSYVGKAKELLEKKKLHLAAGLFPEKTEFLHSVRYLDVQNNKVVMAKRMKELRYAKKQFWVDYMTLSMTDLKADREKIENPDDHEVFLGDPERGMKNGKGWRYTGFLEDKNGVLRPSTKEESLFCMGCHSNIAATTDSSFVFERKLDSSHFQQGWYHWGQKGLEGLKEPKRKDGRYEYTYYLQKNHAGDEFRSNKEIQTRFFEKDGSLKVEMVEALHEDITSLILPSAQRALLLNKAYRVIVQEQSFIYGRDATITPVKTVHKEVKDKQSTQLKAIDTLYGVFAR